MFNPATSADLFPTVQLKSSFVWVQTNLKMPSVAPEAPASMSNHCFKIMCFQQNFSNDFFAKGNTAASLLDNDRALRAPFLSWNTKTQPLKQQPMRNFVTTIFKRMKLRGGGAILNIVTTRYNQIQQRRMVPQWFLAFRKRGNKCVVSVALHFVRAYPFYPRWAGTSRLAVIIFFLAMLE